MCKVMDLLFNVITTFACYRARDKQSCVDQNTHVCVDMKTSNSPVELHNIVTLTLYEYDVTSQNEPRPKENMLRNNAIFH